MASKKYLLLAGMLCLLASYGYSQRVGASYDVKDSSLVPSKRMPQHTEFLNGQYNFPAKPRNQWEIGIKTGLFNISGDIPSQIAFPSFGVHVRKAFGYIFSMRLEYMYGTGKGRTFNQAENFGKNPAWMDYSAPFLNNSGPGSNVVIVSSLYQWTGLASLKNTPFERVFYNY